ncbi:MAG TPA: adenylate/guanylate cyclase domain-containing protein, partial [Stellaceae bacterium]|nr:adenylate/guanylate cyclase domain-containing protein [Stellaceae bacterium]
MKRRRDLKLCGLALLVMAVFAVLHLKAPDLRWLRRLELYAFDLNHRLRGAEPPPSNIVLLMIDDASIADIGRWPVPRRVLAEVVRAAHRAGVKAIGLDILLAESERGGENGGDDELAAAIHAAGNVVLPFTFRFGQDAAAPAPAPVARNAYARLRDAGGEHLLALSPSGLILPLPRLAEVAELGHMLAAYDVDGQARYDYPALGYDLDYYPSMAVRLSQLYLGVAWSEVTLELGRGIALGSVYVPTDAQMRLLVNYRGPAGRFETYSLSRMLAGAVPDSSLRGRIVLVGANALGSRDTFVTPFTSVMPGVERLATIVESMVSGRHLRRLAAAPWLEASAMLGAAVALALAVSRLRFAAAAAMAVAIVASFAISSQVMLERYGLWQASAVPIVATALTFTTLLLYRYSLLDKEHRHIRRVFQRYLSPAMVERLAAQARLPELGGERREITVLFCDLRGFTALTERIEPTAMTRLANAFLSAASEAVFVEGGTIDKYIGDALMAFWNAPVEQPDHAARACRAALGIIDNLQAVNRELAREGFEPLAIGVGINTGPCVVGNFGSRRRFDYSAVGDAVNVASRLEAATKSCGWAILLGDDTAARADGLASLPLGLLELRGRARPVAVWALLGDAE